MLGQCHLLLTGHKVRGLASTSDGASLGSMLGTAAFVAPLVVAWLGAPGYHMVQGMTPAAFGGISFSG